MALHLHVHRGYMMVHFSDPSSFLSDTSQVERSGLSRGVVYLEAFSHNPSDLFIYFIYLTIQVTCKRQR